jgi:hypothetical protein
LLRPRSTPRSSGSTRLTQLAVRLQQRSQVVHRVQCDWVRVFLPNVCSAAVRQLSDERAIVVRCQHSRSLSARRLAYRGAGMASQGDALTAAAEELAAVVSSLVS